MHRKKAGYILLALLVITGLAGTIPGSITGKERRLALRLMKSTKTEVLENLQQWNDKMPGFNMAGGLPAKEYISHIAIAENNLWKLLQASLELPASPGKNFKAKLTDEEVIQLTGNRCYNIAGTEPVKSYKSFDEALNDFKKQRAEHIEYIKSTTENLREHIIETEIGPIDCYQLCLAIASHSRYHAEQFHIK